MSLPSFTSCLGVYPAVNGAVTLVLPAGEVIQYPLPSLRATKRGRPMVKLYERKCAALFEQLRGRTKYLCIEEVPSSDRMLPHTALSRGIAYGTIVGLAYAFEYTVFRVDRSFWLSVLCGETPYRTLVAAYEGLDAFRAMCAVIDARRRALLGSLNVDIPDVRSEAFHPSRHGGALLSIGIAYFGATRRWESPHRNESQPDRGVSSDDDDTALDVDVEPCDHAS